MEKNFYMSFEERRILTARIMQKFGNLEDFYAEVERYGEKNKFGNYWTLKKMTRLSVEGEQSMTRRVARAIAGTIGGEKIDFLDRITQSKYNSKGNTIRKHLERLVGKYIPQNGEIVGISYDNGIEITISNGREDKKIGIEEILDGRVVG